MSSDDSWTASWCCEKLISHEKIASVSPDGGNLVRLLHKEMDEPVLIATMSRRVVSASELHRVYTSINVEFVLNLPKDALFQEDAIEMSELLGFGLGGLGDLYVAANERNFQRYIPKELRFILRGLRQHSSVKTVVRINNRMLMVRRIALEDKRVLLINDYDLTADAIRTGIEEFGKPDVVLASHPSCRISTEGKSAAASCGVQILDFGELLGMLNR